MKTTRRLIQIGFLLLTVVGVFAVRGNAERWCPLGGVEAIYTYVQEGNMLCSLGVSNFYILAGVLLLTLLTRRTFCGYVCPIGAVSELLHQGAQRLGLRSLDVRRGLDRGLSLLKYPVLALILFFTWRTAELVFRGYDPCYVLLSRHGEDIAIWAYVISGAIVLASLWISVPFCRWLCPLAAVLNPFSRFGLGRIRRNETTCTACELCTEACPMGIPVAEMEQVTAARCTSCLDCIDSCAARDDGALVYGPPRPLGRSWSQAALIAIVLGALTTAVAASYAWPLPSFVQQRGEAPQEASAAEVRIEPLTCRGKGNLLWYYLDRDDLFAVEGYLRLEAWPGPGPARARILFDPERTDEEGVKQAIVQPYYDEAGDLWRPSPFEIEGYDPLGFLLED